ncbi:hypothetical protein VUR80DRAFT_8734 [Thermomyces stellatus]
MGVRSENAQARGQRSRTHLTTCLDHRNRGYKHAEALPAPKDINRGTLTPHNHHDPYAAFSQHGECPQTAA